MFYKHALSSIIWTGGIFYQILDFDLLVQKDFRISALVFLKYSRMLYKLVLLHVCNSYHFYGNLRLFIIRSLDHSPHHTYDMLVFCITVEPKWLFQQTIKCRIDCLKEIYYILNLIIPIHMGVFENIANLFLGLSNRNIILDHVYHDMFKNFFTFCRSHVLQKVCMYFTYKVRYTNSSTEIPEFPIAPEIALELLMAANFLDCWLCFH